MHKRKVIFLDFEGGREGWAFGRQFLYLCNEHNLDYNFNRCSRFCHLVTPFEGE